MQKLFIVILLFVGADMQAQTVREIATLATRPRNFVSLDVDYYILLAEQSEQEAFDKTFRKRTPADVMARQKEKLTENKKVSFLKCQPCVLPYAQLDTQANIPFKRNLLGYWRAVCIRTIRLSDSVSYINSLFYRNATIQFEDSSDMIISLTEDAIRVYYKGTDKEKYQVITDSKYELEGKRFIMVYKNLRNEADVFQVGIDSLGRLIVNNSASYQRRESGQSNAYVTTTTQLVLEKLKVAQLNYKEEKKDKVIPSRRVSPN